MNNFFAANKREKLKINEILIENKMIYMKTSKNIIVGNAGHKIPYNTSRSIVILTH